jgi:formylglycine-generating enzyme
MQPPPPTDGTSTEPQRLEDAPGSRNAIDLLDAPDVLDSMAPLESSARRESHAPEATWWHGAAVGALAALAMLAALLLFTVARPYFAALRPQVAGFARAPESLAVTNDKPTETTDPAERAPDAKAKSEDDDDRAPPSLDAQRARLFAQMKRELSLSSEAMTRVFAIFAASPVLGQGNPAISRHPMSRSECRRIRGANADFAPPPGASICGAPNMAPLYDPSVGQTEKDAPVCIDQYEFPNIPCEYPVVHVRAREAALLCRAVGKRICDAHEWEGACAGSLHEARADYEWGRPRKEATWHHNIQRKKVWSYGARKNHTLCATGSERTPGCPGGGFSACGSNTYPAGAFPACKSGLGVFDMHGNVAEHMNISILPEQLASRGDGGFTEMKGSWFAFATAEVHEDDCRWRAPDWHGTKLMSENSHENYHLGFRCCKDLGTAGASGASGTSNDDLDSAEDDAANLGDEGG